MVWSSIVVLLLSIVIFFSYSIANSTSVTEDDFELSVNNTYKAEVQVNDVTILNGEITSKGDDFEILFSIYDADGKRSAFYEEETPFAFQTSVVLAGECSMFIEIQEEGGSIDDLDIKISLTTYGALTICCSGSSSALFFIGLFVAGFILLVVAAVKRRRELYSEPSRFRRSQPPQSPGRGSFHKPGDHPKAPPMNERRFEWDHLNAGDDQKSKRDRSDKEVGPW